VHCSSGDTHYIGADSSHSSGSLAKGDAFQDRTGWLESSPYLPTLASAKGTDETQTLTSSTPHVPELRIAPSYYLIPANADWVLLPRMDLVYLPNANGWQLWKKDQFCLDEEPLPLGKGLASSWMPISYRQLNPCDNERWLVRQRPSRFRGSQILPYGGETCEARWGVSLLQINVSVSQKTNKAPLAKVKCV